MHQANLFAAEHEVLDPCAQRTDLGSGLSLELNGGPKGKAKLYRHGHLIKLVDRTDKVATKLFIIEAVELGAKQSRLAQALGLSRQTLHNYREINKHFGLQGLIHGYRLEDGKSQEKQRALHGEQRPQGNKAAQVAAIRAAQTRQESSTQENLNFSFSESAPSEPLTAQEQPFAETHEWEPTRYGGCFVYWITLISQWRWLELVMGRLGAGWRIMAVFVLMAGRNIGSIEQLKHVRCREAGRVLGLGRLPSRTKIWEWFYQVANQGVAQRLLDDYFGYQLRGGLVGLWLWFTDGHLLPYTGKQKVHYSYSTQRQRPVPGSTNQVTCDGAGRIVDFVIEEGQGDLKRRIVQVAEKWESQLPARPIMVFDREGYDREFFYRLIESNQPFVSWDKHVDTAKLAAIEARRFDTEFTFNGKRYGVFEEPKHFTYTDPQGHKHSFSLRHLVIWNRNSDRRTCALAHADPTQLDLKQATGAILSRWGASENTYKHLQDRHPWHYHPGFKLVESERQEIANPEIKVKEKLITRLRKALNTLYKQLTKTPHRPNKDGTPRRNSRRQRLEAQIEHQEAELNSAQQEKQSLPEKVEVSSLQEYPSIRRVDHQGKCLFDFVTTAVWNARKQMVDWLREYYERENDLVDLFYAITTCQGWVRSTHDAVTVRLEPLQQAKRRAAQEQFCRKLTALGAQTPSGKHLVVEVGESPLR